MKTHKIAIYKILQHQISLLPKKKKKKSLEFRLSLTKYASPGRFMCKVKYTELFFPIYYMTNYKNYKIIHVYYLNKSCKNTCHHSWNVSDLFLDGTKIWNSQLIDQTFYLWEAERIKQIHVRPSCSEDVLIWASTQDRNCWVKSAY